ncbi:MAG: shikimate kinase [Cyanobacteria bacterium J06632_3]
MTSNIVLIGPIGAGKSTLGGLLAKHLGLPQWSMDKRRWAYYQEIGYDDAIAQQKRAQGGWHLQRYWKPFEAYAVERLLSDCENCSASCVIDFGAGHSVYEDDTLFRRVQQALTPYPNVVLLLPSADLAKSARILRERNSDLPENTHLINELFIHHPSNAQLAKLTIYTVEKTPAESCQEIIDKLGLA